MSSTDATPNEAPTWSGDRGQGGRARFVAADLNDLSAVRTLVDDVGAVEVLVNNAGASWFGPTAALDETTFDDLFDGNVRSAYFLVAGIAPDMAERSSGSIINLASMAGQIGFAGEPPTAPPRRRSAP